MADPIDSINGENPSTMLFNIRLVLSLSLWSLCLLPSISPAQTPQTTYTVAIVRDGDSWYFDGAVNRALSELRALSQDRYRLSVRTEYDADYDATLVDQYLRDALADETVDLVYAQGIIATELAAKLDADIRIKPVMSGALQFSDTRGLPISPDGTSLVENYTFITSPRRVGADMDFLNSIAPNETIYVIIDESAIPEMDDLPEAKKDVEVALNTSIEIIGANGSATETLDRIPASAKAAYITILPRMDDGERQKLYQGLANRGIVNVSMLGHDEVRLGALAGLAPNQDQAIARRTALNIHQLLQGISAGSLPVYLPVFDHLLINYDTVANIGWSPDYDTSLAAEFIGGSVELTGDRMTLQEAMRASASYNSNVAISREDQLVAELDTEITRSNLRPRLDGSGSYARNHTTSRISPATTPRYSHQESLGLQLTQILYSEEVWSGLRASEQVAEAAYLNTISTELDAMDQAASAYLDFLVVQSLYEIERENLRLTENNFQLAQLRIDIGAAEPNESYRWEQSRASGQASVIQREGDLRNALVAFNVQIGAARDTEWEFEDVQLEDEDIYFMDTQLLPMISDTKSFEAFGRFIQEYAVANSPELFAFDLQLASQGILLRSTRRWYIPQVSGFANYSRVRQGSDFFNPASENQASVGLQLSVPIFEGGQRKSEILRNQAVIRRLSAQREKALQSIEQRALAAYHGIRTNHPVMRLSRISLQAAEQNYNSIQEKYSQGAATILDLIDAQQALLGQKQQAAIANYEYLKSAFQVQRAMAWFEFEKSPQEKQEWLSLLGRYQREGTSIFENYESYNQDTRSAATNALQDSQNGDSN